MSITAPTSSAFVDADITTDETALFNDGLNALNANLATAGMAGWDSADADLLVIFMATVAQIAADVATTASVVLPAIFRAFGTQLLNLPYQNGTTASVVSTWTFTAPAPLGGYVIEAGTAVSIDGQAFYVADEVDVSSGISSATVLLVASETGTAYNGLGGVGDGFPDVQLNDEINWVATVTTASVTSGGVDQEDDTDYQNRLSAVLELMTPTPITAADFASFVTSDYAQEATNVTVGRSTAISGYYPLARTLSTGGTGPIALTGTATLANASANATLVAPPFYGSVPDIGATITGTAIPGSTTILGSPVPTTTTFTMSANATSIETAETVTISSWTNVKGSTTIFVTDPNGVALSNANMDAMETYLQSLTLQNTLVFVEPPSFNTVYVTAEVHVLPAWVGSEASVNTAVQAAVMTYLSPATWGNASMQGNSTQWLNSGQGFNVIRFNSLVGVIENVPGCQYVVNGSLKIGFSASPSASSDLTMIGPAPLPQSTLAGVIITSDN